MALKKIEGSFKRKNIEQLRRIIIVNIAFLIDNLPEASGRFFLVKCFLSEENELLGTHKKLPPTSKHFLMIPNKTIHRVNNHSCHALKLFYHPPFTLLFSRRQPCN